MLQSEGDQGKEIGLKRTQSSHKIELAYARKVAKSIAMKRFTRTVSIDDIDRVYTNKGASLWDSLGQAAGAVFRNQDDWKFTGQMKKRGRGVSHSRLVMVWKYVGNA